MTDLPGPAYPPSSSFPPPVYGYPGYPPPKKTNTTKIVLIIVGAVLLFCLLGAGGIGYFGYKVYSDNVAPARNVAVTFVKDLRDGDLTAAYDLLCRDARDAYSVTEFTTIVGAGEPIATYDVTGTSIASTNGKTTATVTMTLTTGTGRRADHDFRVVKENGDWKVCGQPY